MSASLALQKLLIERLKDDAGVTSLVPIGSILDRNSLPAPDPSIILGEDQEIEGDRIARNVVEVIATVHIWKTETGLTGVKAIAGALKRAIMVRNFLTMDGYGFSDVHVRSQRFLRDPDGETAHGVVTIEAMAKELS